MLYLRKTNYHFLYGKSCLKWLSEESRPKNLKEKVNKFNICSLKTEDGVNQQSYSWLFLHLTVFCIINNIYIYIILIVIYLSKPSSAALTVNCVKLKVLNFVNNFDIFWLTIPCYLVCMTSTQIQTSNPKFALFYAR